MSQYQFREGRGSQTGAPLLLLFHGTGGDENQFFDLGAQLLPGARRIAVRGDVSEHGALRYFKRTGEGVYDMDDLALRTAAMARFVRERIAEDKPSAVIGLGYSNGANILASVMFAQPDVFDVGVLLHPLIPFAPADQAGLKDKRVLITAGRRDQMIPAEMTERLQAYFTRQGSSIETAWHAGGHDIRSEELQAVLGFLKPYAVLTV
ncbi:alpha/beta hydrolase [Devosia sp.]|uniref:alpha/beta hydrolase n=1 Tax=Devosia sp. TaxID=1871048 RepID=UPI00326415FC